MIIRLQALSFFDLHTEFSHPYLYEHIGQARGTDTHPVAADTGEGTDLSTRAISALRRIPEYDHLHRNRKTYSCLADSLEALQSLERHSLGPFP